MKNSDIKNLNDGDLQSKLAENETHYTKLRLGHKISPVENPIQIRDLRRTIARLKTELTNRQ
jgi:large subunit ribosomal protein L29